MTERLLRSQPVSVAIANHVKARQSLIERSVTWLATESGWARSKRSTICSGKFIFAYPVYLQEIRLKFVYEGHRVKVKVTGAKKVENPCSRNVKLRSAVTPVLIKQREMKFACSIRFSTMADRIVWPPSLSRNRKWPRETKCTHLRVVGLRLEGNFVGR